MNEYRMIKRKEMQDVFVSPYSRNLLDWPKSTNTIMYKSCATLIKERDEGANLMFCATVDSWLAIRVHAL